MENVNFKGRLRKIGNSYYLNVPSYFIKSGVIPEDLRELDVQIKIKKKEDKENNIELLKKILENPELLDLIREMKGQGRALHYSLITDKEQINYVELLSKSFFIPEY